MPTLKSMCIRLGWERIRTTKEFISRINALEAHMPETIEWPQEWNDRGRTRLRSDSKRYPAPAEYIYDWQIKEKLGHKTVEFVRAYYRHTNPKGVQIPGGPPFPEQTDTFDGRNLFAHDKWYNYYCTEENAVRIYEQLKE